MRDRIWYDNNRGRLLRGLPERKETEMPTLDEISENVGCSEFDRLALGKLQMGFFRYRSPKNLYTKKHGHDYIQALENKLRRYRQTHNLELLVDIRNYAMLEFMYPQFSDAYYQNEDDTEHAPPLKKSL